jgi:poly(3-hydroxybutyrate) depolymerase
MGASAAVAIIIRKEKDLVAHFRAAGAISAATAKTPGDLGVHERVAWSRLASRAVVRQGTPGTYYLDEPSWEALRRTRRRMALVLLIVVLFVLIAALIPIFAARAQVSPGNTLEAAAPAGENYDKAEFRFWYPNDAGPLQGVIVLVPGSNGDGRSQAEDSVWQKFATRHKLALVGCRFTDKPHDQNFIEEYVDVSHGTGPALLNALTGFAEKSRHPELASAPLLLWGMSAGGQFNYEFVAWKPERVIAFVVNKGGIYYTALTSRAAREVPGILFVGGKDLEFRTNTITGLFAVNRRGGALWALAEEPGAAHIVGRSRDVALMFYEDVLALRVTPPSPGATQPNALKPIAEKSGFIGDFKTKTFQAMGDGRAPGVPTAWLPTERVARAWQAMVTEKPFEQ